MANGQQQPPQAPQQTDLSDLRIHTLQQARAELPEVKATPPWEEEPTLPVPSTTKLGKAYDAAKSWLGEHEQHLSEKYLTPFRQGLDNMAEDLQQAGESGHTKSGGQLTTPARLLVEGTGALLKQVPVGRNVKETVQAMAVPPELPEGKALSRELKAGERAAIDLSDLRTKQLTPNASGESEASLEAINRAKQEKLAGVSRVRIDTRSGKETPLIGPEAVDAKAGAYDRIVQRRADGSETTLAEGGQARPIAQKAPTAKTPATAKPEQKPNVYDLGEIEAKERRTTPGTSPTGMERRTLPLKGISGPPPEQVRLISEAKKQVAAAQTVPEMTAALNRLKNLTGTEAGLDIAQSGGEKLGEDIRKARAATPAKPLAFPWQIHDLNKKKDVKSDPGYLYHATTAERAQDIAEEGLKIHTPSHGTDQHAWPDGSTEKRSYFTRKADSAWQFAPEEGKPAILRMKRDAAVHKRESTGDFYSKKKIPADKLEILGDDKQWHSVSELAATKLGKK